MTDNTWARRALRVGAGESWAKRVASPLNPSENTVRAWSCLRATSALNEASTQPSFGLSRCAFER